MNSGNLSSQSQPAESKSLIQRIKDQLEAAQGALGLIVSIGTTLLGGAVLFLGWWECLPTYVSVPISIVFVLAGPVSAWMAIRFYRHKPRVLWLTIASAFLMTATGVFLAISIPRMPSWELAKVPVDRSETTSPLYPLADILDTGWELQLEPFLDKVEAARAKLLENAAHKPPSQSSIAFYVSEISPVAMPTEVRLDEAAPNALLAAFVLTRESGESSWHVRSRLGFDQPTRSLPLPQDIECKKRVAIVAVVYLLDSATEQVVISQGASVLVSD